VDCSTIFSRKRALPHNDQWAFGYFKDAGEGMRSIGNLTQCLRARAQILRSVGKIDVPANDTHWQSALAPALANAGIQDRRFHTRIGTHDEQGVGLLQSLLRDWLDRGPRTLLVASHDFERLIGLADTMLVLRAGRLAREVPLAGLDADGLRASYRSALETAE